MVGPAATQPPSGSAVGDEADASVSGVPAVVEDDVPSDLLADLIQVQDADMKPATRQDYARRVSRCSQWLVARFEGAGCHPADRPTPLPAKCLPSPNSKKPYPNRIDYRNVNPEHFALFLASVRKGKKRGEVEVAADVSSPGTRLSHGDVRKYKDALYYHMVQLKIPIQETFRARIKGILANYKKLYAEAKENGEVSEEAAAAMSTAAHRYLSARALLHSNAVGPTTRRPTRSGTRPGRSRRRHWRSWRR